MSKPPNLTSLAAYTRVSTAGQASSGIGLAAQRQAISEAAEQLGYTVTSWHEDAGRSGSSMRHRPALDAALAAIDAGTVGGLVVGKVDRLGRSYEVMQLVGRAAKEGWRLVALDVGLDTTTPEGELVAGALTMAARFEWRRISQRQLEKHEQLRRDGASRGHDATPRDVADRILTLREAGESYRQIAAALNAEAVPTAQGAREWSAASVRSAAITRQREIDAQAAAHYDHR